MRIIIIGGSFGGLTTAFDLRRILPRRNHEIILISKERRFHVYPGLTLGFHGTKDH